MACYHPLKAYKIGINPVTGKDKYMIKPYDYISKQTESLPYKEIPCGKCIGCRVQKSIEWSNRCLCEMQYHESSYFITLTYNPEHVHNVFSYDENGFPRVCSTLVKEDVQKFLKRLRKWWTNQHEPIYDDLKDLNGNIIQEHVLTNGLRYFGCGEYGENTHRAHYHIIVFGLELDKSKLKFYKVNELKQTLYTHPDLDKLWSDDKGQIGFITVAEATRDTCGYVAGYTTKKLYGEASKVYTDRNIIPPYLMMSLKPGIGYQYLVDNVDKMENQHLYIGTKNGSVKFVPPRYFNTKYEEQCMEEFFVLERHMDKQYFAESRKQDILRDTGMNYMEYLSKQELAFKQKKSTARNRIDKT